MSKIEVNNEIVLMRQHVRRAKLHTVRKLIKQVKMLGSKKGDDKQREKYKRKADKLGLELVAIKKIRDDEISRYAITNQRTLQQILAGQELDPETCVLARISNNKVITDRVAEFKKKFPNFEEHLGPGKRKLYKMKRKAGKQAKKQGKATEQSSGPEDADKEDLESERNKDNGSEKSGGESEESSSSDIEENIEPELQEKIVDSKRRAESSYPESKRIKTKPKILPEVKPKEIKLKKAGVKVDKLAGMTLANREAAVKSFTRFLEEKEKKGENENENENEAKVPAGDELRTERKELELEKEVDSFFMTGDGGGEYLSVVVPKSKLTENEEEGAEIGMGDQDSIRSRNNRFFDKVDTKRYDKRNESKNFRGGNNFSRGDRFKTDRNGSRDINNSRKNMRGKGDFKSLDKSSNDNLEMHPSWAAKKKQQEILKLGFQGKKIVFDDAL